MLGHFGFMLSSNARIDASSKNGHTTTPPTKEKGGWVDEKGVPNGAKLVHKSAHGETYDGQIATLFKNANIDKTLRFSLLLMPWAPIYEPCQVILGSCCRPMHALMHHQK